MIHLSGFAEHTTVVVQQNIKINTQYVIIILNMGFLINLFNAI